MDDDDWMESEIAQLNERLTSLETEFAVQNQVAAVERASYATKEDIFRVEALVANCATRQDVARIDASLSEAKIDVARIDAALDSIQKNYATTADLLHVETQLAKMDANMARHLGLMGTRIAEMETRIVRWMLATLITVMGIGSTVVFGIIKLTR